MSSQIQNAALTTRLFLEGREVDLTDEIDIANTYAVANVKDISSKSSAYSKTIKVPGTANNNKLFSFLYDIKSVGSEQTDMLLGIYSATVTNVIPGVTITGVSLSGGTFTPPIITGFEQSSTHYQIDNSNWYIDISGNTDDSGFVVCAYNGVVIACNKITTAVSRYYFPAGFYLFNDLLQITIQQDAAAFSGNIGYNLDFRKRMRAYVIQDNQVILSGYAKIVNACTKDGNSSFEIQISSDLGGFTAALANLRLEDLFTTQGPDLVQDPTGQTSKTIYLNTPYDNVFNITNIKLSWFFDALVVYPLIDYGNDDTVGGKNFYTSNFRPAIHAKDYLDLIFENAGFTYDSAFFDSDYFKSLIIPYKDGNITITDLFIVSVTTLLTTGTTVVPAVSSPQTNSFAIFNSILNDTSGVYNATTQEYTFELPGTYLLDVSVPCNMHCVPGAGSAGIPLVTPEFITFITIDFYHAGASSPYIANYDAGLYQSEQGALTFGGNPSFIGTTTSDTFYISLTGLPIYIATAGDFMRVRLSPTAPVNSAALFYPRFGIGANLPGTATLNVLVNTVTNTMPNLAVSYSTNLDGQTLKFKDFVPKSVKQIDYVTSIIRLFNLYPVPDPHQRNHFNIYTRDEYFGTNNAKDWTSKLDNLSDFTVKPIPELDASQLLFTYKNDKDWFNKQYDSLYGNFTYGARRVETGYAFANSVKDVMSETIFAPTPMVQYGYNIYPSEGSIEIINGDVLTGGGAFPSSDVSSNIIMASGYYAANGTLSPYQSQIGVPVSNNFSGTKFTKAKIGVHIIYWGVEYIIKFVFNDYAFQVTDINGNDTVLIRPVTQGAAHRISDTFYATNDGFSYVNNSTLVIPAIYDSSDNNATHKPVKTEMRILFYQKVDISDPFPIQYTHYTLQYTPFVANGMYFYQTNGVDPGDDDEVNYPYCSHLNDPRYPDKDLLFEKPISLFFNFPFPGTGSPYPTKNLYTRFWINTINEIIDKESKFVDCMMNLNSVDISNLNLNDRIFVNGTDYRINEIRDYSPDASLTSVELIRMPKFTVTTPPPIVDAGPDQIISGSTSTVFEGEVSAGDDDGEEIVDILWTLISGPSGSVIADTSNPTSALSGLASGNTYVFQLYAKDNYGQSATDTMVIQVAGHAPCSPLAFASNEGDVTLPFDSEELDGSGSGCDGSTIVGYQWTQISGTTLILLNGTTTTATASGITTAGSYTFRLTVTDNYGNTGFADTTFTVFPPTTMIIHNGIGSANITSVTGVPGMTFDTGTNLPINGSGQYNGHHSGIAAGTITVNTSGTIPGVGTFHCTLKINGSVVGTQVASSGASYNFSGVTASASDEIRIDLAS